MQELPRNRPTVEDLPQEAEKLFTSAMQEVIVPGFTCDENGVLHTSVELDEDQAARDIALTTDDFDELDEELEAEAAGFSYSAYVEPVTEERKQLVFPAETSPRPALSVEEVEAFFDAKPATAPTVKLEKCPFCGVKSTLEVLHPMVAPTSGCLMCVEQFANKLAEQEESHG